MDPQIRIHTKMSWIRNTGLKPKIHVTGTNPHWNTSMQFLIRDVEQDILCLTVYDRDFFAPDGTTKHELRFFGRNFEISAACVSPEGANKMTGERYQLGFFVTFIVSHFLSKLF